MRTTVTLDEDVARRLRAEMRRSGKPFRTVVNDYLRAGLTRRSPAPAAGPPFAIKVRDLGALKPGLSLDDVGGLLEAVEGARHR